MSPWRLKLELIWYWALVKRQGRCLIWIGPKVANGYGAMNHSAFGEKRAHRWAWVLFTRRAVPKKKFVLHTCDTRRCIRFSHLFLGTQAQNLADMRRKGRAFKPPLHNGKNHWSKKKPLKWKKFLKWVHANRKLPTGKQWHKKRQSRAA